MTSSSTSNPTPDYERAYDEIKNPSLFDIDNLHPICLVVGNEAYEQEGLSMTADDTEEKQSLHNSDYEWPLQT